MATNWIEFIELFAVTFAFMLGMSIFSRAYINTVRRRSIFMKGIITLIPIGFVVFYLFGNSFKSFLYLVLLVISAVMAIEKNNSIPITRPSLRPKFMKFEDRVKDDLGMMSGADPWIGS